MPKGEQAVRLNCSGLTLACERHPFLCFPDHPSHQVWEADRGVAAQARTRSPPEPPCPPNRERTVEGGLSPRRPHLPGPGPCASLSWVLNCTPVNSSTRARLPLPAGDAFLLGTPMAQTTGPRHQHARKTHATGSAGGKEGAGLEENAEPE